MAGNNKPKKVSDWTHAKSGAETIIYLDGTDFIADLFGRRFRENNVAFVRKKLNDYAEHWLEMDWHPVILVEVESGRAHSYRDEGEGVEMKVKTERFYLSQSPAGEIFKSEWDCDERHRKANMRTFGSGAGAVKIIGLPLRAPYKISDDTRLIDYTEDVWDKLEDIKANILRLAEMVDSLVKNNKGLEALVTGNMGPLQLGDGKKK